MVRTERDASSSDPPPRATAVATRATVGLTIRWLLVNNSPSGRRRPRAGSDVLRRFGWSENVEDADRTGVRMSHRQMVHARAARRRRRRAE